MTAPNTDSSFIVAQLCNIHVWAVTSDLGSSEGILMCPTMEISGTGNPASPLPDVIITVAGQFGAPGVPGQNVEIFDLILDIDTTEELPTDLTEADAGQGYWVGNTIFLWSGTEFIPELLGLPGPPGPVPQLSFGCSLVVPPTEAPIVIQQAVSQNPLPINFQNAVTGGNTVVLIVGGFGFMTDAQDQIAFGTPTFNGQEIPGTFAVFNPDTTGYIQSPFTPAEEDFFGLILQGNGMNAILGAWVLPNCPSFAGPLTLVNNINVFTTGVVAYEVSGLGVSPTLEAVTPADNEGSATILTTGATSDTASGNAFIVGASQTFQDSTTSPGTPWVGVQDLVNTWVGHQIQTGAGTEYDWTQNPASALWSAGIFALAADDGTTEIIPTVTNGGENVNLFFNLAVGTGPQGPQFSIGDAQDFEGTVAPAAGDLLFFNGELWQPLPEQVFQIQIFSISESAFSSFNGLTSSQQVAAFPVPPQAFPWKPIVWGHLHAIGAQAPVALSLDSLVSTFTIGCTVTLGDPTSGQQIGRGFGNILNYAIICPHFSTPNDPFATITPGNQVAYVPANHTGTQGTVYVNLSNDGPVGAYSFNGQNSQLFIMVLPVLPPEVMAGLPLNIPAPQSLTGLQTVEQAIGVVEGEIVGTITTDITGIEQDIEREIGI